MTDKLHISNIDRIAETINNKYKKYNNFYIYTNHTEQSKRDKIMYILNHVFDINEMKDQIKHILFLKNHTYKVTSVAFKWIVDENNNSFYVIFGFSTFYNNTGKEQINKKKIHITSCKRLYNKPFEKQVFVNKNTKITYKIVYEWLKQNIKKYKY